MTKPTNINHHNDFDKFEIKGLTRKQIVINALKSIGEGKTDQVADKILEQNNNISWDQAKKWARVELSLLASKPNSGVTGEKIFGSNSYQYKYYGN